MSKKEKKLNGLGEGENEMKAGGKLRGERRQSAANELGAGRVVRGAGRNVRGAGRQSVAKLVPKLRFKEFGGEWEVKRIGDISKTVIAGGTPNTSIKEYWNGNIRWMNSGELNLKKVFEVNGRISKLGLKNSSTKLIPKYCILIGLAGQGRTRGTVAINMIELCTNQSIAAIFPNDKIYNSNYLYHLIDCKYNELRKLSTSSEGRGGLNLQLIKSILVFLPTIPEQQKIAECLSTLDTRITTETQKLETLKAHKKGLMQQLFPTEGETVPKLRFPEFRGKGEWEVKTVDEIFEITRGYVLSMNLVLSDKSEENPYPVYSSQTKNNGLAGYYKDFLFENAITWTTDGANAGDVNYRVGKFYCTNVCGVLLNKTGYANLCIAELINSVSKKHVSYVGNPKLMNGVMGKISIPFPTLPEQQKIADCLSSLDELIVAQTQKINALKSHKKGLMQQLFPSEENTL